MVGATDTVFDVAVTVVFVLVTMGCIAHTMPSIAETMILANRKIFLTREIILRVRRSLASGCETMAVASHARVADTTAMVKAAKTMVDADGQAVGKSELSETTDFDHGICHVDHGV